MKHLAYIRGKSAICSLGSSMDQIVAAVEKKQTPVTQLPLSLIHSEETRPYYRLRRDPAPKEPPDEEDFYGILWEAIDLAMTDAGLTEADMAETALFFGSTSIDIPIYEGRYARSNPQEGDFFSHASCGYGTIAARAAEHFGIHRGCYTFTTACTSSANALLYGANMVEGGQIERALVIGYDLFNNTGFYGFEALKLMAPDTYRPFDKNRNGIIMGEGCAAVILDRQRRTPADFHYAGGANLCDPFNVTTHAEDGEAIAITIRQALADARLRPGDIDAVKAHATGSDNNDRTECNGMRQVFGADLPPVTGLKPYVGHTVGASGVIELVLLTECLKRGFLPATPGFVTPDEALGIQPITDPLPMGRGRFMLNYFGFGGNCTSLIFSNKD